MTRAKEKGDCMSGEFLELYRQHESDNIAMSVQLNRWSLAMIEQMIRELEKKLMASNQPVDEMPKFERWWAEVL